MEEKLLKNDKKKKEDTESIPVPNSESVAEDEEIKSKRRRKRRSHEPDNLTDSQLKEELSKLESDNPIERIPDGRRQRVRIEDAPYQVIRWVEELEKAYSDSKTFVFKTRVKTDSLVVEKVDGDKLETSTEDNTSAKKDGKELISSKILVRLLSTVGISLVLIGGTAFVTKIVVEKSQSRIVVDNYGKEKEINQNNESIDAKVAYDWRKNNPTKISFKDDTITTNYGSLKILGHTEIRDNNGDIITNEQGTDKLEAIICEYENNTDVAQQPIETIISQHIVFENAKVSSNQITELKEESGYTLLYEGEELSLLENKVKAGATRQFIFPIAVTNPYEKVVMDVVEPVKISEKKQLSSNLFQEKNEIDESKKDKLSTYIFYVGKKSFRID